MIKFDKKLFIKLGIIGFSGSTIIYMITFFLQITTIIEILIYDILIIFFGILITISLYLISEKFGKNGIKIAAVCILDTMILSVISELIYYINIPIDYSLEYYNILSFVYGLSAVNFLLYMVNGIGFGFSMISLGRDYSKILFQITAVLWLADIIVSLFLQVVPYLIIFRWIVYGVTCFCIWDMTKSGKKPKKKRKKKPKIKMGFGKN